MDNIQQEVNRLSRILRLQVIEFLFIEDRIKYGAIPLSDEEMAVNKRLVNKLPICTKQLRDLFDDVHQMQKERDMFPHAANVGEMEWCLKNRYIGMFKEKRFNWLPAKNDEDLRRLPSFRELAKIYKNLIANGQKILPPIDEDKVQSEATAIINNLAISLTKESA